MESPRAPEEVKKRHKGAHQQAASKSPIRIENLVVTGKRRGSLISTASCD
jgi:hypothetical protein